jgi:hypothetical protein
LPDVLDAMDEELTWSEFEVFRFSFVMSHVHDPAVIIVAARLTPCMRGPEVVELMPVKWTALAGREAEVPYAHMVGFRHENRTHDTVHFVLLALGF